MAISRPQTSRGAQTGKTSPQSTSARSLGRGWRFAALLLCVAVVVWLGGGLSRVFHWQMARALAVRDYEAAEDALSLLRRVHGTTAETAFWEARLRRKQLRGNEVPPLLEAAAKGGFDPERVRREALLLQAQTGQIEPIVDELHAMMVDPGTDGAEVCEAYVNGALIAGATDLALRVLPVWKQEFPHDPQPHYAEARLLEYREQRDAAVAELQVALKKDGRHWPSRYAFGRLLFEQNRIEEALQQFDVAIQMRDNAAPQYQRARCLRALGRPEEARNLLVDIAHRPADIVRRSFDRVGEPQRGLPVQLELGMVQSATKDFAAAVETLDAVLEDDPHNVDARYARAVALRGVKRTTEADRDFAEVQRVRTLLKEVDRLVDEINLSPQELHLEKRCRVGELFLKHENGRRGEFWLREVLNRDPEYAPAHALLADYYAELSRRDPGYAVLAERHRQAAGDTGPRSDTGRSR